MTYLAIAFPKEYSDDSKIYLKDIISENKGVKFSFILMRNILDTQVESSDNSKYVIMASVSNSR